MGIKHDELVPGGWGGKGYLANMFSRFGLTLEGFDKIWFAQETKCPCCKAKLSHPLYKDMNMALACEVDHCHSQGHVRGIICKRCNHLLGMIRDDRERMIGMVDYLERNGSW